MSDARTNRKARVVVASNRAANGVYADRTGPIITRWLAERSYDVGEPIVVEDGEPVGRALRACLAEQVEVIVTTGGTGISPTDRTPQVTEAVLDYPLPGVADAIRAAGLPEVPTAVLSRGVAGVAGRTFVVNLPGSTGGVRDGLAVLDGILEHAVDQLHGGDHVRQADQGGPSARIALAQVTEAQLSVDEHAHLVDDRSAGAVVTFGGVVRDHDGGMTVRTLYYEGHPSAGDVLARVVAEVAGRSSGVRAVAVSHRLGALEIGDVALACAVAADHRGDAFAACAELVDEVKARLPVWKHQHFADGTDEWVNSP
ncbi:molybdenum cofactor biosynthesis protein MoaE [Amycolatopsis minnesotensis]|uniref:Molybdenum cofactor biosynthesis protein MoaE n=1 Tax=Amycolatopsis minnesotensis TaxID=337894 RepID=A0ABN2Q3H6_9PSEU